MKTIRNLRRAHHLSQHDLAVRVDVSVITVHYWERGHVEPDDRQLRALAELFGVAVDEIVLVDSHRRRRGHKG